MTRRSARARALALVAAIAATVTAVHGAEAAAPSPSPASSRRIVSLVPSLTETVCALGACNQLVGTDRYSDWPSSVAGLPKLGGLGDAQLERIVGLRPDLVLVAPSERLGPRLEALGLHVLTLRTDTLADVRTASDRIAQALGTPERSTLLWQGIDAEQRAAADSVPPSVRGRSVYFEVDPTPYAAGAASYLGQMLAALGLVNIVPVALGPFPRLNPEYVVSARPDIVMAEAETIARMPKRPGWSALRGLRPGHRCAWSRAENLVLVRPGPRLGEAARIVAACLAALGPPA